MMHFFVVAYPSEFACFYCDGIVQNFFSLSQPCEYIIHLFLTFVSLFVPALLKHTS